MQMQQQAGRGDPAKTVFVGNIAYGSSEQALLELLQTVGAVVSFRLVNDRDTGKPRGFGFCEYNDEETAKNAMRALNGSEFNGRALRVTHSEESQARQAPGGLRPRPTNEPVVKPPASANSVDAITKVVKSLTQQQRIEILSQMKILLEKNPAGAKQVLLQNPQLAQALLHIEVLFGLVTPDDIKALQKIGGVAAKGIPPPPSRPPVVAPPVQAPVPPVQQPPPSGPPPLEAVQGQSHHDAALENALSTLNLPPQQKQILRDVVKLSDAQIAQLPQDVQDQIKQLQAQIKQADVFTEQQIEEAMSQLNLPMQQKQILKEVLKLGPDQISQLPAEIQQQVRQLQDQIRASRNTQPPQSQQQPFRPPPPGRRF